MRILFLLLTFATQALAAAPVTLLLSPPETHHARQLTPAPPVPTELRLGPVEPLFSASEARALVELGSGTLASTVRVKTPSLEAAERIRAWMQQRFPGWSVQENQAVTVKDHPEGAEPFERYQWGLANLGQRVYGPEGLVLDRDRTLPVPLVLGEDIGARRVAPVTNERRPKVVVAILDTGLDHDRDPRGERITGIHREFQGQVVDKSGRGEECDATDLAQRRDRYRACAARGATDCIDAESDRDQNGYPFDCLGWNLTATMQAGTPPAPVPAVTQDVLGDGDTRDRLGHGTHVAGIIGAALNGEGTRGVITKNVAILPVKVVDRAPNPPRVPTVIGTLERDSCTLEDNPTRDLFFEVTSCAPEDIVARTLARLRMPRSSDPIIQPRERLLNPESRPVGFVDQIARGMLYAIRSGAHVISMSLAWPSDADTDIMKRMVSLAIERGIVVIASAGNDSTEARTSPCQYPGVVCVGAHDPQGRLASFSNFGAAVDIAAPGQNILSTWIRLGPNGTRVSRKWTTGPLGYEQKSGTSMAAPFVAGAVARLLDLGIAPDEAVSRLLVGARPMPAHVDPANNHPIVRTGNADLKRAIDATPEALILPKQKGPLVLEWNPRSDSIELDLELTNHWSQALSPRITLELESETEPTLEGARISPQAFENAAPWPAGETRRLSARIELSGSLAERLKLNGRFFLKLGIASDAARPRRLTLPIELVSTVAPGGTIPGALELPIDGSPVPLSADIRTVNGHDGRAVSEYLVSETTSGRTRLRLYRESAVPPLVPRYALVGTHEHDAIPNLIVLADVQRVDHRVGEPSGYVLIYQVKAAEGVNTPSLRFEFYDHELKPVKVLRYDNLLAAIDSERWIWLQASENGRPVKTPAWVNFGLLPREEFPDIDYYPTFHAGLDDPDDDRAMRALRDRFATPRTDEDSRLTLLDSMKATRRDQSLRNRFYFLEPRERKERDPRTGAETGEAKAIARTAGLSPLAPSSGKHDFRDYVPLQLISQTAEERAEGSVRVLLARPERNRFGRDIHGSLRYAVVRVKMARTTEPDGSRAWIFEDPRELLGPEQSANLLGLPDVAPMLALGRGVVGDARAMLLGQPLTRGQYEANLLTTGTGPVPSVRTQVLSLTARTASGLPRRPDSLLRAAGSFHSPRRTAIFSETQYDLQYDDVFTDQRAVTTLGRFSFMAQAVVSRLLFPTVVGDESAPDGELLPAMMIPAQLRSAANMEIIVPSYDPSGRLLRLVTPARMRLQAAPGCRPMGNPIPARGDAPPSIAFFCGDRFIRVPLTY